MANKNLNERGGILLVTDAGDMQAWLPLGVENGWREISWRPDNYPALHVSDITVTPEKLAEFIQQNFVGWIVKKLNLKGVEIDVSAVIVEPAGVS